MNTFYLKKQLFQKTFLALCYTFFIFLIPNMAKAQLNCADVTITSPPMVCLNDGEITITLPANFGGTAPYTFTGSILPIGSPPPFPSQSPATGSNTLTIGALAPGSYTISITDASGNNSPCVVNTVVSTTYTPMQVPVPSWTGCQAQVSIVGGKAPYTISVINPSSPPNAPPISSDTTSNTTYTFSNLPNGPKAIKIEDACGQTVTSANGIIAYVPIVLSAVFTLPDKVIATVTSATNSQYTYELYIGGVLQETKVTTDKNVTFTGVVPACSGNYVKVTDNTCSDTKTTPFIVPNATPVLTVNCVNFTNGTASVSAMGGKSPYTYECFNNLGVKIADSNTGNFIGITATSVYFKVKDACGVEVNSVVYSKPLLNIFSASANCINSKVTLSGAFQSSVTSPIFVPLTFTGLTSTYSSTSATANFTKNDIPTNFVLEIKDKCDNSFKIKDSIQFDFLPNQPCKTIKAGSINYLIKYVNGSNIGFYSFTAAPNSLTYELYNDANVLVATNNTGIFTNINYDKDYTVKIITPCGLTTTKTTKIPSPTGNPNPTVLYSCSGNVLMGTVSSVGLTAPMSITSVPPGTPAAFDILLPLGTYLVEDCTGSKVMELKSSDAPKPTPVTYSTSSKCVGNTFKHTVYAGGNNLGNGPYILQDANGVSMPSTGNDGKTFENLDAGTYTLTSLNAGCTAPTQIILVDPPKSPIYYTLEGPFCNNGVFFWNITNVNSFHGGPYTLKDAVGNLMTSANINGTVYENLTAGKYYLNGQCAAENEINLVNPPLVPIPYVLSVDCKNDKLLYKIKVTDTKLKPFKLKLGAIEISGQEEGAYTTFIDLVPGNYTLTGGCSNDTPVVLPDFPTMPQIAATVTGNCPNDRYLKAEVDDIGIIWANWLVGKPLITIPSSFTSCGGGSNFILKHLSTGSTFTPNSNDCDAGKNKIEFKQIPSGNYELTLNFCGYSNKKNIYIPPHISPTATTTKAVVCDITDKAEIGLKIKTNFYPVKIEWIACGSSTVKAELAKDYTDSIYVHKNLGIGTYCYRITDACNYSTPPNVNSAVALLGSIRPNYRDSCGYVVLYMDKLLGATYEWTSPPSNVVLSTAEKLIVVAETFVRDFQVKIALPNNTICTRNIKIKKNSGISPVPFINKSQLTTCEANGTIPLSVKIANDVPNEFVTLIEWLDGNKNVLGTGWNFSPNKTGKYYAKFTNDSMNIKCKFTLDSINIIVPTEKLDAKITQKNITCFRDKDGQIEIEGKGGIAPYKYLWSTGSTATKITNLDSLAYTCTVTDSINCTSIHVIKITEPKLLVVKVKAKNTDNCDANWSVIITGGTKPYQVSFDGNTPVSTSDSTLFCVKVGTHTVNVTDAHGCKTDTTKTFVKHNWPIVYDTVKVCFGGNYFVNKLGFTKGKIYDKTGIYYDTLSMSDLSVPSCGTCETVFVTNLTILEQVKVVAEADDYLLCPKTTTIIKIVSTTGGLGNPYYYQWMVVSSPPGTIVYDVPAGEQTVTAYDKMGCKGSYLIKIDSSKTLFSNTSASEILCKGDKGTISVTAKGGTGIYDYKWSNGSTAPAIKDLAAGTYSCTITDGNQCALVNTYILEDYVPTPYSTNKANLAVCGNNKTILSIVPPSGTDAQPFTFTLKNDKKDSIYLHPFDKNKGIWAEIGKGKYILTFVNKFKCIVYDTIIVKSLSSGAKIIQKDSLCEGNKVLLSSSMANTIGVTYSWFDGTNASSPKDWKPIGTPNAALEVSKTSIIYLVQINKNGCNDSIKHTIKAFENPKIDLKGGVLCSSKIQLDVKLSNNSKNDSIAYFWNPTNKNVPIIEVSKIGTYAVTVVNTVTGCKSNTFAEVQNANNWTPDIKESKKLCQGKSITLKADVANGVQITWYKDNIEMSAWKNLLEITISDSGNYKIKVIDGACSGESKIFKVNLFPNPDVSIAQDLKVCFEKKITIIAETTTKGLLDFLWSNTAKTKEITVGKGSYSLTVTDANGCVATANTNIDEYEALKAEIVKPKKMCPNENITLSLTNTYISYDWSNGSKSATFTTNKSGSYSVTVTNDKGCTAVANVIIEDAVPVVPILDTKPVCYNAKGLVELTNANDFDKITWSNGTTNPTISFDKIDSFKVKTIDKNNCSGEAFIVTTMFPKPKVTPIIPIICEGLNGKISLKEPFEKYLWSDASTNPTLPVDTTGTYYVTVTDINGCTVETFAALQIKETPKTTIAGASKVCIGDSIFVELSDTKNIKKYTWSDNLSTTSQAVYPNVGTYTVTYTDNNGCVGTATKTVETADGLEVKIDFVKKCKGDTVTLNPGKFGKYVWSNGSFLQEIKVTQAGTYIVTVSNKNCMGVAKVDVSFFDLPTPIITTKEKPCFGKKTTLNLNYDKNIWSSGEINQLSVEKPKGDYTVTVTNSDGCTAKTAITVTELDKLIPETVSGEGCEGTTITIGLKNNYPKITWDSLQNTQFITVTKGGTYTVKVVDANGCKGENFAQATFNPLPKVECVATKTPVCPKETTTISVNSATATKFDWSNSITTKSQTVGLGFYAVTATDDKGCKASDTIVITEFKPISIVLDVKNLKLCAKDESAISLFFNGLDGKKATVTLADGSGFLVIKNITKDTIFTYKPDNDKTLSIQTVSIEGYDCAIDFDKNKKFEVKVSKLYATLNAKSQKCFGVKNGSLNLNTNSSNITWNIASFANDKIFNNLGAGYFTVTVSDDLGCFLSANATLIEPKPIEVSVTSQKVCKDAKDGSFEIKANGGTGSLKYYVQGKAYDDGKMTNLSEGIYTIMVKDSEGCASQTDKVTIENYPVLSLVLDAGDTSSIVEGYDSLRIKATITIDGRIVKNVLDEKFRVFEWTPYDCPNCLSIFARTDSATTYKLKITDQYGCKASEKIRIGVDKLVKEVDYPNAVTDGNPFKILNPERSVRKFNMLRIFDRWGNMVYQELNFNPKNQIGWDGSFRGVDCDPGVYVWIAVVEFLDGSSKILNGDVTVVR